MEHLKLHDIWLYLLVILLFGIFLLLIYIICRCSDRVQQPRKRESVLQFNVSGSAQNLMANFAEWKGELPTYVSHWSFQDECDDELEWKRHLSLKSHCAECEKLLEEGEQNSNTIVANINEIGLGHVTVV